MDCPCGDGSLSDRDVAVCFTSKQTAPLDGEAQKASLSQWFFVCLNDPST